MTQRYWPGWIFVWVVIILCRIIEHFPPFMFIGTVGLAAACSYLIGRWSVGETRR